MGVDRARKDLITRSLFNRQALAGDRRLIDGAVSSGHNAIERNALAWLHPHQLVDDHRGNANQGPFA